jgi:hypothetical protein
MDTTEFSSPQDKDSGVHSLNLSQLEVIQIAERLSTCRHNINNNLALMVASAEIVKRKPERIDKVIDTIFQQTEKLMNELNSFSENLKKVLDIN